MRRILLLILCAAALGFGSASGQESVSREDQIQRIRQLPPDEKQRLKAALDRFRALPAAEREALRAKARQIGEERLGELTGRDFPRLRKRHVFLEKEMAELWRLLGAPQRLESLTDQERAYLRERSLRGFQVFLRQQTLEAAGAAAEFARLGPVERRERLSRGADAVVEKLLAERPPEDVARFRAMTAPEQRRERSRMLAEWRMRETVDFAKRFDAQVLFRFLGGTPEVRRQFVERAVRWHQLGAVLRADGVSPQAMATLLELRPEERAQVAAFYEQSHELAPEERRNRVEDKIRELYGKSALEEAGADGVRRERAMPRLRDILRQRALRTRASQAPSEAAPK